MKENLSKLLKNASMLLAIAIIIMFIFGVTFFLNNPFYIFIRFLELCASFILIYSISLIGFITYIINNPTLLLLHL